MLDTSPAALDGYIARIRPEYEQALKELVEIPSVSTDPSFAPHVRRAAEWALAFFRRHGLAAEMIETAGYPVVIGLIAHPEARRTLTIYNHIDVQPANEPEWQTDPFVFAQAGDTYRGRGTTDDKGPALAAFYAALAARDQGLKLNIRFIWECEEEIGSPNFDAFLAEHAGRLETDSVVVSDTIWISRGKPAAPLGLRGLVTFRLTLETGTKDVHSGLAGGAARNPIAELCELITEMVDARSGRIKIPGIYEQVRPVSEAELQGFVASGFDADEFKRAHGLKCLRMSAPEELTQAIWARPTFEVHGIVGGYTGAGVKAIVPPRAEAKLSMRLVPDLRPEEVMARVKAYVAQKNPDVVFHEGGKLEPYIGSAEGPYADAVKDSLRFAFGADPAFVREGGSIGAVVTMQQHLACPIMFIGLSLPEHGYHAPNENFDWEMAAGGMKAFGQYFRLVAAM